MKKVFLSLTVGLSVVPIISNNKQLNKKQCNKKRIVKAIRFFIEADSVAIKAVCQVALG